MTPLGIDDVLQLAPDAASAKAARGLVVPAKWSCLGCNDEAVWGECKGSGSNPYRVQVDRSGPAFKCSCPSRKFPCKHGLALLLMLAQQADGFDNGAPPQWVAEWLESRRGRAERQERRKLEQAATEADPAAAARREAARARRMADGAAELTRWLGDRLRQGLAALPGQPAPWEAIAAHMVDAQLPGLALRLRRTAAGIGQGQAWPARVLGEMGKLQLMCDGLARIDTLPPGARSDLRAALGVATDREAVLAEGERVADQWLVSGQCCDEEERLWVRRVWLHGLASGREALLVDYAHGGRNFDTNWTSGSVYAAELAFFPGTAALRALCADLPQPQPRAAGPAEQGLADALEQLAGHVAANPWQAPLPLLVDGGIPERGEDGWRLDADGSTLPLALGEDDGWQLLAESGGAALTLFGEWDGRAMRPLTAWRGAPVWVLQA